MKLTVAEAAALLTASEAEVYGWLRDEGLPFHLVQERYFIHRAELFAWAHERHHRLQPQVFGTPADDELARALRGGGLFRLAAPPDRAAAAAAIVARLGLPPGTDRACIAAVLAARPDLGFAVDADGLALPRVGEPILVPARTAVYLFAFESPWSPKNAPISRAFVVVAPTMRTFQRVLAELDAALYDPRFRGLVFSATAADELVLAAREADASPGAS